MASEFEADLEGAHRELKSAREDLLAIIGSLPEDGLGRARRGGWTVGRVLEHVIGGDWSHVRHVVELRGRSAAPAEAESGTPASLADAVRRLAASRGALLAALEEVDETSFYRLGSVGREEYSVLSVLENAAHHDREHAGQIRSIVAGA